jgi:hypothetical protein
MKNTGDWDRILFWAWGGGGGKKFPIKIESKGNRKRHNNTLISQCQPCFSHFVRLRILPTVFHKPVLQKTYWRRANTGHLIPFKVKLKILGDD